MALVTILQVTINANLGTTDRYEAIPMSLNLYEDTRTFYQDSLDPANDVFGKEFKDSINKGSEIQEVEILSLEIFFSI